MAMEGATATRDTLDSTVKNQLVLVTQVVDTVITMEGATATQDTLGSTVMRCQVGRRHADRRVGRTDWWCVFYTN